MILYDVTMMNEEGSKDLKISGLQTYHSFLLRLWKTQEIREGTWHFSLENPQTRNILAFNDFQSLCLYLTQIMGITQANQSLLEKRRSK
jgi:hypothetical protein